MHDIHVTEGLVLGKRAVGEANILVSVLTPAHGLVVASARSARLGRSKLRYGLEPLTLARFSFVRGKREWRLTGVERVMRLEPSRSLGRVSALLLRLVAGEEPNQKLFDEVVRGFTLLAEASPAKEHAEVGAPRNFQRQGSTEQSLETVLVLRILSTLGYLPKTEALSPFVEREFSLELSAQALERRAVLVRAINESLKATGL